eukprot:6491277-Amphidinium_carterae.2
MDRMPGRVREATHCMPRQVRNELATYNTDAKKLVLAVLNGQVLQRVNTNVRVGRAISPCDSGEELTVEQQDDEFLRGLAGDSIVVHWVAISLMSELHQKFIREKKPHPARTTLHYFWTAVEDPK